MLYQLFEYSEERKRRFPLGKPYALLFSLSENTFQMGVKRLKKVDASIKPLTEVLQESPKYNPEFCTMIPGSQEDSEALYKDNF